MTRGNAGAQGPERMPLRLAFCGSGSKSPLLACPRPQVGVEQVGSCAFISSPSHQALSLSSGFCGPPWNRGWGCSLRKESP